MSPKAVSKPLYIIMTRDIFDKMKSSRKLMLTVFVWIIGTGLWLGLTVTHDGTQPFEWVNFTTITVGSYLFANVGEHATNAYKEAKVNRSAPEQTD